MDRLRTRRTTRKNDQETHTLISEALSDEEFSQEMGNTSTPKKQKKQIKKKGSNNKTDEDVMENGPTKSSTVVSASENAQRHQLERKMLE